MAIARFLPCRSIRKRYAQGSSSFPCIPKAVAGGVVIIKIMAIIPVAEINSEDKIIPPSFLLGGEFLFKRRGYVCVQILFKRLITWRKIGKESVKILDTHRKSLLFSGFFVIIRL